MAEDEGTVRSKRNWPALIIGVIILLGVVGAMVYYVGVVQPTVSTARQQDEAPPNLGTPNPENVDRENADALAAGERRRQAEEAQAEEHQQFTEQLDRSVAETEAMRGGFRSRGGIERISRNNPKCQHSRFCMQFTPGYTRAQVRQMEEFILAELGSPGRQTPPAQFANWQVKTTEQVQGVTVTCTALRETILNDRTPEACWWQNRWSTTRAPRREPETATAQETSTTTSEPGVY